MKFIIGEKIGFLQERGEGTILKILGTNLYDVLDEVGFERTLRGEELVKIHTSSFEIEDESLLMRGEGAGGPTPLSKEGKKHSSKLKKGTDVKEINLHIEELVESHSGWSNFQILSKQLREFHAFFRKAQENRILKMVVIHGVGEGVLKEEIRSFLSKHQGVEYYDSDFRRYGSGATTVEIHYNYK
jgi:hypothetical protein